MEKYRKRIVDSILERKLRSSGAVLIEGAKWCGKTTTAEQIAKSTLYMNDPKNTAQNRRLASLDPSLLLDGEKPRLIDEWQIAPELWDAIRFSVDHSNGYGQYILTGSASPVRSEKMTHTGTGRFSWLLMRTMSLFESGESTGEVSLKDLFAGDNKVSGHNKLDLQDIAFVTCRGGWPQTLEIEDPDTALEPAFNYYESIIHNDMGLPGISNRNPHRLTRFMSSYSRNIGTQTSVAKIRADILANDSSSFSEDTAYSYINALKQIFVIEDLPAWNPNLRSRTAIRTSDTRYFMDPAIGTASLGIGPKDLVNDLNTFGGLFENLCIRDLRIYADANNGAAYHYRDKDGLECDAVIHVRGGKYGLIEIKLGGDDAIEHGAETLKKLTRKLDTDKMSEPSFLMVLTAIGDFSYMREDGVLVVPIGTLRD